MNIWEILSNKKFLLFLIISTITLLILIIILISQNINYTTQKEEYSLLFNELNSINTNISNIISNISIATESTNKLKQQISFYENETIRLNNDYQLKDSERDKLIYTKNDLIAQKEYLTKKINEYKNIDLNAVQKKIEDKKNELKFWEKKRINLTIENSKINFDYKNLELSEKMKIIKRCYDSEIYGFNSYQLFSNCDGYALLFLVKTNNDKNFGAYISKFYEGNPIIIDDNSGIINFDRKIILKHYKDKKCFLTCDLHKNEFINIGESFIIYNDGTIEINSNICYDNEELNYAEISKNKIQYLEIYIIALE